MGAMREFVDNAIGTTVIGGVGTAVVAMYKLTVARSRGLADGFLHWQRMRVLGQGLAIGAVGLKMATSWILICDEKPWGIIPLLLRKPSIDVDEDVK